MKVIGINGSSRKDGNMAIVGKTPEVTMPQIAEALTVHIEWFVGRWIIFKRSELYRVTEGAKKVAGL